MPDPDVSDSTIRTPVRVQSLGSGSAGNAFLVQRGERTLMVDCGVGIRTMQAEMRRFGTNPKSLDGLLITHEHGDHIRTLHRVMRPDLPVIATEGTADMAGVPRAQLLPFVQGRPAEFAGFTIWALRVRHDAIDPCGFLIETPEARITILTDLGSWQDHLTAPIAASDLVVLEANHDEQMLWRGPYPAHLKRRVASPVGHLSNEVCGASLARAMRDAMPGMPVWLAHLSDTNNRPDVAEATVNAALAAEDLTFAVHALPRRTPGPVWISGDRTPDTTAAPLAVSRLPAMPSGSGSPDDGGQPRFQRTLFD
ncbi:MAG: MBL fold metallo-hydrolase [Thermomicrobiales bacterium]